MNLKQIKEVWDIYPYEGGYLLFSKENGSGNRMVCKYFCQIFGSNGYFHVSDKPKTKDIAILKTQVDE